MIISFYALESLTITKKREKREKKMKIGREITMYLNTFFYSLIVHDDFNFNETRRLLVGI